MQEMLREFAGVFWVDTSVSFSHHELVTWSKIVRQTRGYMLFCAAGHSVFSATHPAMLPYFGVTNRTTKTMSMLQASGQLLFRTRETYNKYVLWYTLCALDENCIAPKDARMDCDFDIDDMWNTHGDCHRYDQSAASIILNEHTGSNKEEYCMPGGPVEVIRGTRAQLDVPVCRYIL